MTHFHVFILLVIIAISASHRAKREIFRGQDYRFQRAYELSRLRFDDRHPDRPKTFFVREFHEGHDVPKPFLQLTQPEKLADPEVTESILSGGGDSSPSPLIETVTPASRQKDYSHSQRLYATKAAIKAALTSGDKDLSILQYLKAKEQADREKSGGIGISGSVSHPQSPIGDGDKKANAQVQFDEQIKEDLDRITAYDPNKSFGQRLRPYTFSPGLYPTRKPVIVTQRPTTPVSDGHMAKLRRLYPHLFPPTSEPEFERSPSPVIPSTPTVSNGHSGGHVDPLLHALGIPNPVSPFVRNNTASSPSSSGANLPNFSGYDSYFPTQNQIFRKPNATAVRPFVPTPLAQLAHAVNSWGLPKYPVDFWTSARNASSLFGPRLPGAAYPSRFPNNAISALTLYPDIRNSTFPGIPGYIRYDFPGYSQVPFTGFRCDQMPYQHGYYADVVAGCQAFHICQKDGRMDSFLCPNGTLFHQKVMTCDWWYLVDCPSSPSFYYLNGRIGVLPPLPATLSRFD